jgi:hypothetical protein
MPISQNIENMGGRAIYGYNQAIKKAINEQVAIEFGMAVAQPQAGAPVYGSAVAGAPRKRQLDWQGRRGGGMRMTTPQAPKRLGLGFQPPPEVVPAAPALQLSAISPVLLQPTTATLSMAVPLGQATLSSVPLGATVASMSESKRGVDLNLDEFSLTEAKTASEERQLGDWGFCQVSSGNLSASMVDEFWASVDGRAKASSFLEEGKQLLWRVFNPHLSDRRDEGDLFVPPSTNFSHVQSLIDLTTDEQYFRQQRASHFCSADFSKSSPGFLFPRTWICSVEVSNGPWPEEGLRSSKLHAVQDHTLSTSALKLITPTFDKYADDGTRFRIYTVGSLEVRTVQEHDSAEVIGAVFSKGGVKQSPVDNAVAWQMHKENRVAKVVFYVEKSQPDFAYFVLIEMVEQNVLVAELSKTGAAMWEWNPSSLDERRSLAKALSVVDCSQQQRKISANEVRSVCPAAHGVGSHRARKDFALAVRSAVVDRLEGN